MDIKVDQEYLEKAIELHKSYPVVDAHLDLAGEILLRRQGGEENIIRNHYLSHFREAGVNLILSSIYVENRNLDHAWDDALAQINALKQDTEGVRELMLIGSKRDLKQALSEKKIGILLYMEGLDCIGEDLDKLTELKKLGVRGAALTWSRSNALAVGCCRALEQKQIPGPITDSGIKALQKMEELSMFLDVSHLNDEGFEQICRLARRPFIATHSGSRAVHFSYRNLTDEQMAALADQGGIIGLNGYRYIVGSLEGNHLEMLCRHVEHEVEYIGAEHVGYGFDLCDSYDRARAALDGSELPEQNDCLLHHGQIPLVTAALLSRGMEEQDVCRIIGKNFIDYFQKMLPQD